jgi:predicted RNA-binding Zn ribbon-like protein
MMEPVILDPGDYDGTYKLVGGEISLDLVNTVSWPNTAREHDWLDRPGNVTAWAVAAGIISEQSREALDARAQARLGKELGQVCQVRCDLRNVLWPLAFGEQPTGEAVEKLNKWVHQICIRRRIDPENHQWTWIDPSTLEDIFAPVIWNAAHVLTRLDRKRIGHCPSCNWIFYDTTRNRSRR